METNSYLKSAKGWRGFFVRGRVLHNALQNTPASRPEAVDRARRLIADPGFPPKGMERRMARHLAAQILAEMDSMPS
jgi:hypothetical protein